MVKTKYKNRSSLNSLCCYSIVALIPQAEELNKKVKNDRLASNGFHVHYLPYADDMRNLPKNDTTRAANDEVDLFKNVIRGLKFKYRADRFENPALQTLWRSIEATALNKAEPDEFIDLTIPSVENQNRKVEGYIDELKQMIFPPGYVMGETKRSANKRKVCFSHFGLLIYFKKQTLMRRGNKKFLSCLIDNGYMSFYMTFIAHK